MEEAIEEKLPLINAHAHAAMVAFRGAGEDLPLDKWLKDVIWPLEAKMINPDFVYEQTKIAIDEMRKNGIEAFMDMYFFEDSVARACEEKKMPVVLGEGLIDLKGEDVFKVIMTIFGIDKSKQLSELHIDMHLCISIGHPLI